MGALRLAWLLLAACGTQSVIEHGTAEECGSCHITQYEAWRTSRHALSGESEAFKALLPHVESNWGQVARARCEACHQPGHVDAAVIGCASCHLAVGNREDANGALVVKAEAAVASPRVPVDPPHAVTKRRFFESPNLCGTCHEVKGPGLLEELTLSEFFASPLEQGQSCTSCHAPHEAHGLALLSRALELKVEHGAVVLTNTGAAHAVPTGMTALRDIWVEVTVDGQTVARAISLAAELDAPLFVESSKILPRGLKPFESATWPLPSSAREVETVLFSRRVRADTALALGLEVETAQEAARVRLSLR